MKSIKGTQTEKNLAAAFSLESQTVILLTAYRKAAKSEGYRAIGEHLKRRAKNHRTQALALLKLMEGGSVEITAIVDVAAPGKTLDNLALVAKRFHTKWEDTYAEYAQVAQDEGFVHVAKLFHLLLEVSRQQEEVFSHIAEKVRAKKIFSSDEEGSWECSKCGHRHFGKSAPSECPLCGSPQGYFKKACNCSCSK